MLLSGDKSSCSLPNNLNMNDPKYYKKSDSIFLSLTDCISYAIDCKEKYKINNNISGYKTKLLELLEIIPINLLKSYNQRLFYIQKQINDLAHPFFGMSKYFKI